MRLLLSGEGPSDIGGISTGLQGREFVAGPMAHIVDKIIVSVLDFSPIAADCVDHVSRPALAAKAKSMPRKPPMLLPGVKRPAGYAGHLLQAVALGKCAQELATEHNDAVVSVLFRDSDGTNSDDLKRWENIVSSIEYGLSMSGARFGVAMVPKPKQESWLVCAFKRIDPYLNCAFLERASGNDSSPNSLKGQLDDCFEAALATQDMTELVRESFDWARMDMPSFKVFSDSLRKACNDVYGLTSAAY